MNSVIRRGRLRSWAWNKFNTCHWPRNMERLKQTVFLTFIFALRTDILEVFPIWKELHFPQGQDIDSCSLIKRKKNKTEEKSLSRAGNFKVFQPPLLVLSKPDVIIKVFIENSLRKQTCNNLHGNKMNKENKYLLLLKGHLLIKTDIESYL